MGKLIAKKYPVTMLGRCADHTYVECGTGSKVWMCWGTKTNGEPFNSGSGSSARANKIAEPNGRAGINRYLIDGVCHQAANRILAPAGILVSTARGYGLSVAIFSQYGRSSFNLHSNVSGDLPECDSPWLKTDEEIAMFHSDTRSKHSSIESKLSKKVQKFYSQANTQIRTVEDALIFNLKAFEHETNILFKDSLPKNAFVGLKQAKFQAETRLFHLDLDMQSKTIKPTEFVIEFNKMTEKFQNDAGNALSLKSYKQMFGLSPDEHVLLADPSAVDECYGENTAIAVYGSKSIERT